MRIGFSYGSCSRVSKTEHLLSRRGAVRRRQEKRAEVASRRGVIKCFALRAIRIRLFNDRELNREEDCVGRKLVVLLTDVTVLTCSGTSQVSQTHVIR